MRKDRSFKNCVLTHSSLETGSVMNISGKFFDCGIDFLIDTGSSISVLSSDFVRTNQLQSACIPMYAVCVADDREVIYDKSISVPVECQGISFECFFLLRRNCQ